jgi:hypothetical protein
MFTFTHETTTHLPPERLHAALAAIARWPEWDPGLEWTAIDGPAIVGAPFRLKPRGGPVVKLNVEAADAPRHFADVAHLPLAKMRTAHWFEPLPEGGTRFKVTITVTGPLGFLWTRLVAREQADSAPDHARAFLAFAETYA